MESVRLHPALLCPALALLAGCAPLTMNPARNTALNVNGPAPDVVILAFSGRCTQPCRAPRDNYDYLSSRGTLDALADTIRGVGFTVQVAGYADHAQAEFQPLKVVQAQQGYAQLLNDFEQMKLRWFTGPRPPRLVLLGHSHGSVWLHHLVRNNPHIPFALQIDLDSNCTSWRPDHGFTLSTLNLNETYPAVSACTAIHVAPLGKNMLDKDIVWPNVAHNLEVQSKRLPARTGPSGGSWINYTFEITRNIRPDGTRTGLEQLISTREDHSNVAYPQSDAMTWIKERTRKIAQQWKEQDNTQRSGWEPLTPRP